VRAVTSPRPARLALLPRTAALATALGGAALAAPRTAHADANDLVLARLSEQVMNGQEMISIGQNLEFRSLASELGVALAPRLLTPADTIGFGGFQLTTDLAFTNISAGERFWRARAGADDPEGGTANGGGMLSTVGVFARKGIWLPLPSFELAVGGVHLRDSGMWSAQGYAKFALHEGYHGLPIPSVAVRGGASRLFGSTDLDLTVASLDVSVSKQLGIGGTWTLSPYAGWNTLFILPTSEVLDPTPNIDALDPANMDDSKLDFVMRDQAAIIRHRFFLGATFQYDIVQFTLEGQFALAGGSVDDRAGTSTPCEFDSSTDRCDATDQAGAQRTITLSAGLDF
jgi:hypothetical protein